VILMHMTAESWRVILVRGWWDGDHVRVRILTTGGDDREWTGTASAAPDLVRKLLAELGDGEDPPPPTAVDG
jgi:hypothetical protein